MPGSVRLFDGSSDLRRITWTDAPLSVLSFARDAIDRTRQLALGGRREVDDWTLSTELSHTRSINRLFFCGPFLGARAAEFTHDLSGRVPSTAVGGIDLLDLANLAYTGLAYRVRPFLGELSALRLHAQWHGRRGPIERFALGWRGAVRRAHIEPGLVFGDVPVSGLGAAASAPTRPARSSTGTRPACRWTVTPACAPCAPASASTRACCCVPPPRAASRGRASSGCRPR